MKSLMPIQEKRGSKTISFPNIKSQMILTMRAAYVRWRIVRLKLVTSARKTVPDSKIIIGKYRDKNVARMNPKSSDSDNPMEKTRRLMMPESRTRGARENIKRRAVESEHSFF